MITPAPPSYAGYRFPAEVISHAVWLYFRFPLSLRHVDELLAARGIVVSHETVRQWGLKFGQAFANQIRRSLPSLECRRRVRSRTDERRAPEVNVAVRALNRMLDLGRPESVRVA